VPWTKRIASPPSSTSSSTFPSRVKCAAKGRRNYEFMRSLIAQGRAAGELDLRFGVDDLAMGIYGQLNTYIMVRLLVPDCPLDRRTARQIVRLFLEGAGGCQHKANGKARATSSNLRSQSRS